MHHPCLGIPAALRDICMFTLVGLAVAGLVWIILNLAGVVMIEHSAPNFENETSWDDDRVRTRPQVIYETMSINTVCYFLELCWAVKCLYPYYRGKLHLDNGLLKICIAFALFSSLTAQPHGVMETISDPRITGSKGLCLYYLAWRPIADLEVAALDMSFAALVTHVYESFYSFAKQSGASRLNLVMENLLAFLCLPYGLKGVMDFTIGTSSVLMGLTGQDARATPFTPANYDNNSSHLKTFLHVIGGFVIALTWIGLVVVVASQYPIWKKLQIRVRQHPVRAELASRPVVWIFLSLSFLPLFQNFLHGCWAYSMGRDGPWGQVFEMSCDMDNTTTPEWDPNFKQYNKAELSTFVNINHWVLNTWWIALPSVYIFWACYRINYFSAKAKHEAQYLKAIHYYVVPVACIKLFIQAPSAVIAYWFMYQIIHEERFEDLAPYIGCLFCFQFWLTTCMIRFWTIHSITYEKHSGNLQKKYEEFTKAMSVGRLTHEAMIAGAVPICDATPEESKKYVKSGSIVTEGLEHCRAVKLSSITFEDFSGSPVIDKSSHKIHKMLSEPCAEPDFFVSHSWHDDDREKWEALLAVNARFKQDTGRDALFWIDKYCIDQTDIADNLRFLAVFVMCSKKMLMIVGPTYFERLWCCWELFIRFVAAKDMRHTVVWPLSGADIASSIKNFKVDHVKCFKEEDKIKILEIINSFKDGNGKAFFQDQIRSTISALGVNFQQHNQISIRRLLPIRDSRSSTVRPINVPVRRVAHKAHQLGSN